MLGRLQTMEQQMLQHSQKNFNSDAAANDDDIFHCLVLCNIVGEEKLGIGFW
jgi:hypothetical protein